VPVLVIADIFGIAGRRPELVSVLAGAERDAAAEDGCLRYSTAASLDDPDHFVVVSEWRDQAAVDAHYATPGFATFQMALDGLLARPSEMTMYDVGATRRPLPSEPMDPRDAD
jgi:quinol monooxygenase YgiN